MVVAMMVANSSDEEDDDNTRDDTDTAELKQPATSSTQSEKESTGQDDNESPGTLTVMKYERHTAVRLRQEITDVVFGAVKFINTVNLLNKTIKKLADMLHLPPHLHSEFGVLYKKDIMYAVNNKRNSVAQDCKKRLTGKDVFDCCVCILL